MRHGDDGSNLQEVLKYTGGTWADCAAVFDYGRKKYVEWNWLKGMSWADVIGSCARHLLQMINGEELDAESGLSHAGHVMCNVVMLAQYGLTFKEGDNRPWAPLVDKAHTVKVTITGGGGGGGGRGVSTREFEVGEKPVTIGEGKAFGATAPQQGITGPFTTLLRAFDLTPKEGSGLTSYLRVNKPKE